MIQQQQVRERDDKRGDKVGDGMKGRRGGDKIRWDGRRWNERRGEEVM
jgi:hypothetical protein